MQTVATTNYVHFIDNAVEMPRRRLVQSLTFGIEDVLNELGDVWVECRQRDWDGHGALPVEQETLRLAYQLIDSLPLGFPKPSIGAEPDGQLTLEWRKNSHRVLSVSVDPEGMLHFAGLYGIGRRFGSMPMFSQVPDELIRLVQEL